MSLFRKILLALALMNALGVLLNMFGVFFNVLGLVIAAAVLIGFAFVGAIICLIFALK